MKNVSIPSETVSSNSTNIKLHAHDDVNNKSNKFTKGNIQNSQKTVKCPECNFHTNRSQSLKYHKNGVHKPRQFKCTECDYAAIKSYALNRHINSVHKSIRPFKCTDCDYAANELGTLNNHIKSVHKHL